MIIRELSTVKTVDWGNGLSRRFLLRADGMGFTITHTTVRAGTKSRLEYQNHLEACYCIGGSGQVIELDGTVHPIEVGTLYALDQHDAHWLVGGETEDLHLVCVFTPALSGDEVHNLDESRSSVYGAELS